ncbi:unnamed protein product, partial [Amoebophrya sp. A25]|eukprot:GSA25T00027441001.1
MLAKLKEHCQKEGKKREGAVLTQNRRILSQIKLEPFERRELMAAGEDEEDDDEGSFSCTPCDMLTGQSDSARQYLEELQVNMDAKEAGDPNWCAADYENYKAICLDKPDCCAAPPEAPYNETERMGPMGGPMPMNPNVPMLRQLSGGFGGAFLSTTGSFTLSSGGAGAAMGFSPPAVYTCDAPPVAPMRRGWMMSGPVTFSPSNSGGNSRALSEVGVSSGYKSRRKGIKRSFTPYSSANGQVDSKGRRLDMEFGAPGTAGDPADMNWVPEAGETINYHRCATGQDIEKAGEQPDIEMPGMEAMNYDRRRLASNPLAHFELLQRERHGHLFNRHTARARSLTQNTHGVPIDVFRHKKKAVPYKMRLRAFERERLNRRRMQQLTSDDKQDPEPTIHVDGSGRRLTMWDQSTCDAAVEPSVIYECMTGAARSPSTEMQSPNNLNTAAGAPKPQKNSVQKPLTFVSFVNRAMSDGEGGLPACQKLPLEERKMPMMGATSNFDLDPTNTYAHNLAADTMGPGCIKKCGCHFVGMLPNGESVLANVCKHKNEQECPCIMQKKACHKAILETWRSMGGYEPVHKPAGDSTPTQRRARRLQQRRSLRTHRLDTNNFRRLARSDVKLLKHENKMRRERRALRMKRMLGERKLDEIETFEKQFYNLFGRRHRSMRVLTGKPGQRFRNLKMIENYHTNVRRLRRERRERRKLSAASTQHPAFSTMYPNDDFAHPGEPTPLGVVMANPGQPGGTAAPYTNFPIAGVPGTGVSSTTPPPTYVEAHAPTMYTTPPVNPGEVPGVSSSVLMATSPAPMYYGPNGGASMDITQVVNHNLFDQASSKFYSLVMVSVNTTTDVTAWQSHDLCYLAVMWKSNSTAIGPDGLPADRIQECIQAVKYDPEYYGYSPVLFEEYHAGNAFCPDPEDLEDPDFPSGLKDILQNGHYDNGQGSIDNGMNMMEDLQPGMICEHGIPVPDDAFDEAEMDDDAREPPPAEVKEAACGNECVNPGDGSMKAELMQHADSFKHMPETCLEFTKMYLGLPDYDPDTGMTTEAVPKDYCGEFHDMNVGYLMEYEISMAFSHGEFKRGEMRHPALADYVHEVEVRPCVSKGVKERAHLELMVRKHGDADLHEAIYHQIPEGEMRVELPKKKAESGGLWNALNPPDKRDPAAVGFV